MTRFICISLVVLVLAGCSAYPAGTQCMRDADTPEGEAACAAMYPPEDNEFRTCLDAGGSYEDEYGDGWSCYLPGFERPE